jgi:hypothetical protein
MRIAFASFWGVVKRENQACFSVWQQEPGVRFLSLLLHQDFSVDYPERTKGQNGIHQTH